MAVWLLAIQGAEVHNRELGSAQRDRLHEVAEIRGGYISSAAAAPPVGERVRGLQVGDIGPEGLIIWTELRTVSAPRELQRYEVREGDVLLPLRSMRMTATAARGVPRRVVAVGSWAMLTPRTDLLNPDFLVWYLNHPATGRRLAQLAQGSSLQFLSLRAVRDFEIEVPSVALQAQIARVHQLERTVTAMERDLARARRQLVDALTMEALNLGGARSPRPRGTEGVEP